MRGFDYDDDAPGEPYTMQWTDSICGLGDYPSGNDITDLAPGKIHFFRAKVCTEGGGLKYGSELIFLTKPEAPTGFNATAADTNQINLSWTKGIGAESTMVRRKTGSYPINRSDGSEAYFGDGTFHNDDGLFSGITYYYRAWSKVTENELEQWSDNYAEDLATTLSIPAGPTDFKMSAISYSTISCSWTDNSYNEDGFFVANESDSNLVSGADTTAPNTTSDIIPSLLENTQYKWFVIAFNKIGNGYSNIDSAYTLCDKPTGADTTCVACDSVGLKVDPFPNSTAGLSAYIWDCIYGVGGSDTIFTDGTTNWTDKELTQNTTYKWYVYYRNGDGIWTPEYDSVVITTPTCGSGIEEGMELKLESALGGAKLEIYPNPFTTKTEIRYTWPVSVSGHEPQARITIYNLSGRLIRTFTVNHQPSTVNQTIWDRKDDVGKVVGSGIYFLQLRVGKFTQTKQIVVIGK